MKLKFDELKTAVKWIEANSPNEWIHVKEDGYKLVIICQENHTENTVTIEISDTDKINMLPSITKKEVLR